MELSYTEAVPVEAIERHLRERRQREGGARALTLNLVCRAQNREDAAMVLERLAGLGRLHPARVLMLMPGSEARAGWGIETGSSEMLSLEVIPEAAASLVAPLLIGDLPVVLWWRGGDPLGRREFQDLARMAQRVLVDAHQMGIEPARLRLLLEEMRSGNYLTDLTWSRLTPWRLLLCQAMEAHAAGGALRGITRVTITAGHGHGGAHNLAAALVAGWLAHQLEWTPAERLGPHQLRLSRARGGAVEMRFELGASSGKAILRGVELELAGADRLIRLQHQGREVSLRLEERGAEVGQWAGPAAGEELLRSETDMLSEELSISGAEPLFPQSLERGLAILDVLANEVLANGPLGGAA